MTVKAREHTQWSAVERHHLQVENKRINVASPNKTNGQETYQRHTATLKELQEYQACIGHSLDITAISHILHMAGLLVGLWEWLD